MSPAARQISQTAESDARRGGSWSSPGARSLPSALLSFHRAGGHAGDEVLGEEGVQESHRYRAEQGASHQFTPEEDVAADQVTADADGDRLDRRVLQEHQGVDVLVPGKREGEHAR